VSRLVERDAPSTEPAWQLERRFVTVNGVRRVLRLVRFDAGWVASVDTPSGPTIGVDRSPYLAASRALEPLGIGMVEAMATVGRAR
jgi:hypothetical protein